MLKKIISDRFHFPVNFFRRFPLLPCSGAGILLVVLAAPGQYGRCLPLSARLPVLTVRYRWSSSNRFGARDSRGGLISLGSAGGVDCAAWVHRRFLCLHSAQPGTFGRPLGIALAR